MEHGGERPGPSGDQRPVPTPRSVKLLIPPFWKGNVALWFAQVEAQFRRSNVTNDDEKFDSVVAVIDTSILTQVSDLVINPPVNNKYEALKNRLNECFTDSEDRKLQRLLKDMALGDKKPSQLLREMKELANQSVSEDLMKTLWLQNLPSNVRAILSVSNESTLNTLVPLADKIMEVNQPNVSQISAVTSERRQEDTRFTELEAKIEILTQKLDTALKRNSRQPFRSSSGNRQRRRSQSRTEREKKESGTWKCRYHFWYGNKAFRCESPCSYKQKQGRQPENEQANR